MKQRPGVLFIVENDYFPRDARVRNECASLASTYRCHVLAPRGKRERFLETVESATCVRFPHFEAASLRFIPLEYLIAAFWIAFLGPLIAAVRGIRIIHVANPPDFVVPLLGWLKIFGVRLVFDVHDLSVETFKGKVASRSRLGRSLEAALRSLESASIGIADAIVATNQSIRQHVTDQRPGALVCVVRNSNGIRYRSLREVDKAPRDGALRIGYFGVLADDEAAGLANFFPIAETMELRGMPYRIAVVGDGPGLAGLQAEAARRRLSDRFEFHGFVGLPKAFELIKEFDFGLVTWGDLPKNRMHTAMKVMDYMCCAVPVCSLPLAEQVRSTQNIGIHEATFEAIAEKMIDTYQDADRFEALRQRTLDHFNAVLCWERQQGALLDVYATLAGTAQPSMP